MNKLILLLLVFFGGQINTSYSYAETVDTGYYCYSQVVHTVLDYSESSLCGATKNQCEQSKDYTEKYASLRRDISVSTGECRFQPKAALLVYEDKLNGTVRMSFGSFKHCEKMRELWKAEKEDIIAVSNCLASTGLNYETSTVKQWILKLSN